MNSKTMLRLLALLLAAALLAGCSVSCPTGPDPDAAGDPASDPAPADTPDEPDDTPEMPETPTVTAGGVTVRTDYSNYEPHTAPEAVYTRLTPEHIPDLKAGDDYGTIYPFTGALLYAKDGWRDGEYYGFFDESGRIIADPTYTSVRRLESYTESGSHAMPFWVLGRSGSVTIHDDGDYPYIEGREVYAVASLDGSFVTDCIYGYVMALGENIVCAESWSSGTFTVFSPDGDVLLTEQDLDFADRMPEYGWSLRGGENDRILVSLADGDYFMNYDGELVLGPYNNAYGFSGGLAAVSADGTYYGVIDRDGHTFLPDRFTSITTDCARGVIACDSENHRAALYSRTGELVFEHDGDYMTETTYGFCIRLWDDGKTFMVDPDGGELFTPISSAWSEMYGTAWAVAQTADGLVAQNALTSNRVTLKGLTTLSPLYTDVMTGMPSSLPFIIGYNYNESDVPTYLMDEDLNVLMEVENGGQVYALKDDLMGVEYVLIQDGGRYTVYDSGLNELAQATTNPTVLGGLVFTTDGYATTARAFDGTVRFRYPLTTSLDD